MALEKIVADIIARHLNDLASSHRICVAPGIRINTIVAAKTRDPLERLRAGATDLPTRVLEEGQLSKGRIFLRLHTAELANELNISPNQIDPTALQVDSPFTLRRRGVEGKIIAGDYELEPDTTMLRALARAHAWTTDMQKGKPLGELAAKTGHSES